MSTDTEWIAVDWGTSNLRAWAVGASGEPVATFESGEGMGALSPNDFEPTLLNLIGDHLPEIGSVPVICCGMVGAAQGWAEAPYAAAPCEAPGAKQARRVTAKDPRLDVYILPGVKQMQPADVMRGEETQIAGYIAQNPDFDGILCLPGTHTKWVHISAKEIVSFRTFMTGELFALLSVHSVIQHSVDTEGWDDDAFAAAIADAMSRPQTLASDLFSLRAGMLLHGTGAEASKARLSGLLLGLELAGARPYWLGQKVVLIGSETLSRLYQSALLAQGADASIADGSALTLAGLTAAYLSLKETPE
ncbi:2-dehydro-3-deoxygalactonokinase [Actibacterium pelagium]|uniref:2-keto-3-deoxy-galactonokinase n=1 Tax=Actibacterium pelagium TaxID=2029103 RepID=A0A917ANG3_9RHOB|nr:2-dehydro-3-deoxygalactonokinase [Actibacterium pelagium]GGE62238.1 2-keto-3-deoxy-galactonokinase [Actibacterium pelagium]